MSPRLTIVVPVLDDAASLRRLLTRLGSVDPRAEVIVSDGGSRDDPAAVARACGAAFTTGEAGRGAQLNLGASRAEGEILWFLHADSRPPEGAVALLLGAMEDPDIVGGAFGFRLGAAGAWPCLLSAAVNFRSKCLHLPYGDQGPFVRASVFRELGGFRPIPIMEDVEFVRRLRRRGRLVILDPAMEVSPRRWEREGALRTTLRNQFLLAAFTVGVPAERLVRWYPTVREGA